MATLSATDYAKLRGITPTAVRNAARQSVVREQKDWWDMPGVNSFQQIGGRTWVFECDEQWVAKRKKLLNQTT